MKCRNSDSAALIVIKRESVTEVLINPIIRTRTRQFRHIYDIILQVFPIKVIHLSYLICEEITLIQKVYTSIPLSCEVGQTDRLVLQMLVQTY
jgi:hypothetical protein